MSPPAAPPAGAAGPAYLAKLEAKLRTYAAYVGGEQFTQDHPGAFTYRTGIKKWIWTTFHTYQWDLNYENPAVFNSMAADMLFLSNALLKI